MKKNLLLVLFLLGLQSEVMSMARPQTGWDIARDILQGAGRVIGDVADAAGREFRAAAKYFKDQYEAAEARTRAQRERLVAQIDEIEKQLIALSSKPRTPEITAQIQTLEDALERNKARLEKLEAASKAWADAQAGLANAFVETFKQSLKNTNNEIAARLAAQRELEKAVAVEDAKMNAIMSGVERILGDRQRLANIAGTVGLAALLVTVGVKGALIGSRYVESLIFTPKLVDDSSATWKRYLNLEKKEASRMEQFVADPEVHQKVMSIARRIVRAINEGKKLPNVCFEGPPGVGKTMMAKEIIKAIGNKADWVMMSGASFAKFGDEAEQVLQLQKLLDWMKELKRRGKKLIVFADESEAFVQERELPFTTKAQKNLVQALLAALPTPYDDSICFIFATNHYYILDKAIKDRIPPSGLVTFKLPNPEQRKKILQIYLDIIIKKKGGKVSPEIEKIILEEFAQQAEGLSGRALEAVIEQMDGEIGRDKVLTEEIVRIAMRDAIEKRDRDRQEAAKIQKLIGQIEQKQSAGHN